MTECPNGCHKYERKKSYNWFLHHPKCDLFSPSYDEVGMNMFKILGEMPAMEQEIAELKAQKAEIQATLIKQTGSIAALRDIRKGAHVLLPKQILDICNEGLRGKE